MRLSAVVPGVMYSESLLHTYIRRYKLGLLHQVCNNLLMRDIEIDEAVDRCMYEEGMEVFIRNLKRICTTPRIDLDERLQPAIGEEALADVFNEELRVVKAAKAAEAEAAAKAAEAEAAAKEEATEIADGDGAEAPPGESGDGQDPPREKPASAVSGSPPATPTRARPPSATGSSGSGSRSGTGSKQSSGRSSRSSRRTGRSSLTFREEDKLPGAETIPETFSSSPQHRAVAAVVLKRSGLQNWDLLRKSVIKKSGMEGSEEQSQASGIGSQELELLKTFSLSLMAGDDNAAQEQQHVSFQLAVSLGVEHSWASEVKPSTPLLNEVDFGVVREMLESADDPIQELKRCDKVWRSAALTRLSFMVKKLNDEDVIGLEVLTEGLNSWRSG